MKTYKEVLDFIEKHPPCYPAEHDIVNGWFDELKERYGKLKVYILIHENVDVGHAVNCAAHASLSMYLRHREEPYVEEWAAFSFRKVSCKVTDKQFQKAKEFPGHQIITEEHLDQQEVAIIFTPRPEWPKFFNHLKLYR